MDNSKNDERRLVLYKNGTYKWVKSGNESAILPFQISSDGSEITFENGSPENIHKIYELGPNRLRYGQRTVSSHYEFILVPFDYKE
jgi:hypothetical protein